MRIVVQTKSMTMKNKKFNRLYCNVSFDCEAMVWNIHGMIMLHISAYCCIWHLQTTFNDLKKITKYGYAVKTSFCELAQ